MHKICLSTIEKLRSKSLTLANKVTMVYQVISTKLTEEEHTKLLDACNVKGCTPFALKETIMEKTEHQNVSPKKAKEELADEEIRKFVVLNENTCFKSKTADSKMDASNRSITNLAPCIPNIIPPCLMIILVQLL